MKNSENTHDAKLVYEKTHPSLNETFNQYRKNQPTNKKIKKQTKKHQCIFYSKLENDPQLLPRYTDNFDEQKKLGISFRFS